MTIGDYVVIEKGTIIEVNLILHIFEIDGGFVLPSLPVRSPLQWEVTCILEPTAPSDNEPLSVIVAGLSYCLSLRLLLLSSFSLLPSLFSLFSLTLSFYLSSSLSLSLSLSSLSVLFQSFFAYFLLGVVHGGWWPCFPHSNNIETLNPLPFPLLTYSRLCVSPFVTKQRKTFPIRSLTE